MKHTQTFTVLVTADSLITVEASSAADLNVLPELRQMTDDIVDLLCRAERILFQNTATCLLRRWYRTDG